MEHLLDDDEDMAEMYLTEKFIQHLENSSTTSLNEGGDMDDEYIPVDLDDGYLIISTSIRLCHHFSPVICYTLFSLGILILLNQDSC